MHERLGLSNSITSNELCCICKNNLQFPSVLWSSVVSLTRSLVHSESRTKHDMCVCWVNCCCCFISFFLFGRFFYNFLFFRFVYVAVCWFNVCCWVLDGNVNWFHTHTHTLTICCCCSLLSLSCPFSPTIYAAKPIHQICVCGLTVTTDAIYTDVTTNTIQTMRSHTHSDTWQCTDSRSSRNELRRGVRSICCWIRITLNCYDFFCGLR